jgi:lipid II:glycine glycyltransferase (peptidoglycan interpeptide bridge formation enzyme)
MAEKSNLTIVNTLDPKIWREFTDKHPQGNIFHTPEMFKVFERTRGHQPKLWAAVDNDGRLLALLPPVQVTIKDGLMRRLTTRSIAYGSVLSYPDSAGNEAVAALLRSYRQSMKSEALYTEFRNLSDQSAIRPVLEKSGYVHEDHLNYLIDLRCSPNELLQSFGPRTRKHIRRESKKCQLVFEQVTHSAQVKTCYDLIKKSYLAASVPVADISMFEAAFDVLNPLNMVKFWLVRKDSVYIAASVELIYKDVIFGWYGGVDRDYSSCTPSEYLTWCILDWGVRNGFRMYDFGGAGTPEEEYGVRDFKAKFGGQLVCYGRDKWVHSPNLLRFSTAGYEIIRRFVKF